jgi:hypothetical protein
MARRCALMQAAQNSPGHVAQPILSPSLASGAPQLGQ